MIALPGSKVYTFADGKYHVARLANGSIQAFRYGEEWRNLTGDNLLVAILDALDDARDEARERGERGD